MTFDPTNRSQSLLGIIYSGDWLAFIKEAYVFRMISHDKTAHYDTSLHMRTTTSIYRHLSQYLDTMDAEARARGETEDTTIDHHFRSGVYLGMGMSHLVLSLIPGKLQTLVELFGYKGDRHLGLELLMRAGGWSREHGEPSISAR